MIIEYLKNKNYTYWLQWEESWFCLGAFITKMYTIMDNSQIDQISLKYNHWNADRKNERYDHLEYTDHPNYVEIKVNVKVL